MPADLHGLATVSLRSSYEFDPAVAVPVVASRGDLGTAAVISPASGSTPTTAEPPAPAPAPPQHGPEAALGSFVHPLSLSLSKTAARAAASSQ